MKTNPLTYDEPFIKKFKSETAYYVYDVNTNEILNVDEVVYSIIDDLYKLSQEDIVRKWESRFDRTEVSRALEEIRYAQIEDGLFSASRPHQINPYGGRDVKAQIEEPCFQHLILNVAESCNLRCRYCVYGGAYPKRRLHSLKRMSAGTAENALDLFLVKSAGIDEPHIGFFGGEPLTNLNLIKHCVAYVEARQPGRHCFSLTTNGTLLTDHVVDYLVKKGFRLSISLDGPEDVHDRCRVDRLERGTWHRVMGNLERFHSRHSDYVENNVSVLAVVVSQSAMAKAKRFFEDHAWLSRIGVSASYPNYTPNRPWEEGEGPSESDSSDGRQNLRRQCEQQLIETGRLTPFLEGLFALELGQIYRRLRHDGFSAGIHINGCCFPGQRRLFVDCDGTLFACERFDDGYPLGTVDEGVRASNVLKLIQDYQEFCSPCLDCWAVRFCSKCFVSCFSNGKFDERLKDAECGAFRNDFERTFATYHRVLEKNPNALQFLGDVTLS
jgi:uncharacterized protein